MKVSFSDSSVAFQDKSDKELKLSYLLFWAISKPYLVSFLSFITKFSLFLHLPIEWVIKQTVYKQFCGGETLKETEKVIQALQKQNIGAILDYSLEGENNETRFEEATKELIELIEYASKNSNIPFTCMKISGIAKNEILEKVSSNKLLSDKEKNAYNKIIDRLNRICTKSFELGIPVYIDAEESWIQPAIDSLTETMMEKYNKNKALVFCTLQMYRHDRNSYFDELLNKARANNFKLGVKIVRGAYLEKENLRAKTFNYPTPINQTKQKTDSEYNLAIEKAIKNYDIVELCAGTHNEKSCLLVTQLMDEYNIASNDKKIWLSQLYGMSDHISYNLAKANYNVTKYLPFGPVKSTIPYLLRRAKENTAIAGQMGQELAKITEEINRRNLAHFVTEKPKKLF